MSTDPIDAAGAPVVVGDTVRVLSVPDWLFKNLPSEDRTGIKAMVGTNAKVVGFDADGNAEIEGGDRLSPRTIWIEPRCLKKI